MSFPLKLLRCSKSSQVFESCMGDWGDVEQLMNSLQVIKQEILESIFNAFKLSDKLPLNFLVFTSRECKSIQQSLF